MIFHLKLEYNTCLSACNCNCATHPPLWTTLHKAHVLLDVLNKIAINQLCWLLWNYLFQMACFDWLLPIDTFGLTPLDQCIQIFHFFVRLSVDVRIVVFVAVHLHLLSIVMLCCLITILTLICLLISFNSFLMMEKKTDRRKRNCCVFLEALPSHHKNMNVLECGGSEIRSNDNVGADCRS